MSRQTTRGTRFVIPIDSTGADVTTFKDPGVFTLSAGTYHYILGGQDAPFVGVQITGYTAALTITSATIYDTFHSEAKVTNFSTTVGEWMTEDPPSPPAFVSVDGTGWSVSAASVVAAAGSGVGGASWHLGETCAPRTRLTIVVTVGGDVLVSTWAKG